MEPRSSICRSSPKPANAFEEDEASSFKVEYRLAPSCAGTRFTLISEFELKRLPRVLHGTFARGVRRDVRSQLQRVKRLLEG